MDNPLPKLLDNIKKIDFFHKTNSIVGIDVGSSSVKVVQLKKDKGRLILETYGELATGPYADLMVGQVANLPTEKVSTLLADLLRESNITTTRGALAVPLRSSLLLTIELPDMAKSDLKNAVPIEARKYIPVPISEVMLDWWIIPKQTGDSMIITDNPESPSTEKMVEVLVVAIHKDTIKQYESIAKGINLQSDFYEIETFSAIRSVMHNDLTASIMVDLGASTTKVAVVDYGVVRLSHTITKGSQDITTAISRSLGVSFGKAEEIKRRGGLLEKPGEESVGSSVEPVVEYIFSELNQVMVNYQQKHNRAVGKVVLIGGGALLKGILDIAKRTIEVPVVIGAPFDKVEAPVFLSKVLHEAGPEFAVAIGTALRSVQEL